MYSVKTDIIIEIWNLGHKWDASHMCWLLITRYTGNAGLNVMMYKVTMNQWQLLVLSLIVCWSMPCTMHMYVQLLLTWRPEPCRWGWTVCSAQYLLYVVCYMYCPNPILCWCLLMLCIFQVSVHMFQPGLSLTEPLASCFLLFNWGLFFAICCLSLATFYDYPFTQKACTSYVQ